MKNNNEVLGGFSALFDEFSQNGISAENLPGVTLVDDPNEDSESSFSVENEEDEDEDSILDQIKQGEEADEDEDKSGDKVEEDINDDDNKADGTPEVDEQEAKLASSFFDVLAEEIGWEGVDEESKPKSIQDLVKYVRSTIEENSKPEYASKDIEMLNDFVKNGGTIEDFLNSGGSDLDYDDLDLSDVNTQRALVTEYLREKGLSDEQIIRKVDKYEDADILEDEAKDAKEDLKLIKEERNKALLAEQEKRNQRAIEEQQAFYSSVVNEIEGLDDIRGIKIPKQDKKELLKYIFDVESDGKTRYQKDYMKSNKPLIESAYIQMKGDSLLSSAKKAGETAAVAKFRATLESNKTGGTKRSISTGSATPLWALASKQLIN